MSETVSVRNNTLPIVMICVLFFVFGCVTWANSTWIQFFKLSFSLTDTQSFLVTFSSYIAFFFLALPSSVILKKLGFKNGIVMGLFVLALGSLLFIPAARLQSFSLFLIGIFIQGSALALLQTAANPYMTIIGPIESAAKRISMAGICNKFAGIIVPLIMGTLFLANASTIEEQITSAGTDMERVRHVGELLGRVNTPSVVLAVFFSLLAFIFIKVKLPDVEEENEVIDSNSEKTLSKTSLFHYPHLFLGALCIFLYVGAEVMAGDIIGVYGKRLGLSADISTYLTSLTLTAMLVGYIVGIIAIPKYISQQKALYVCAVLGIVFSILAYLLPGFPSIVFIALLGLANSLMWPAIFPLGIQGLGKFTKIGSAVMIMGISGGAIWPLFYGFLSETLHLNFQLAYFIAVIPCYLYILFFALKGHKIGLKES
ncbi:sugar MFS transporter [Olivibacter sp. CPCC 100613]|uniref:sugar MFS transporter n=1 Tax=Olivibacter sp. CPCC 100613 TaxID=3079931 RepID=UPI002FF4D41D